MARSRLAVVIPCHNEATTLGAVVREAAKHADVIVVDDRSDDGSRAVGEAAGARVIAASAPGYDGALATGLRHAVQSGYDGAVTLDADGEHDPALVPAFDQALSAGAGLVCGIRVRPQRAAEFVVAASGKALFGIDDPLCGMKGYSRRVIEDWLASGSPLMLNMAPAVLWRRSGGDLTQIAITGQVRRDASRFGQAPRANLRILKTWVALLTGTSSKGRP